MSKRSPPRKGLSSPTKNKENNKKTTRSAIQKNQVSKTVNPRSLRSSPRKEAIAQVPRTPSKPASNKKKKKSIKEKKVISTSPIQSVHKSELAKDKKKSSNKIKPKKRLIELEEINNKFLASYTNFDYLLAILEIVNNKQFYGLNYSDKSKYFWNNAITLKICDKIFAGFKPETLRKYWGLISKSNNLDKITRAILKLRDNPDALKLKLKTVVDWLGNLFKDNSATVDLEASLVDLINKEGKPKEGNSADKTEHKKTRKVLVPKPRIIENNPKPLPVLSKEVEAMNTKRRLYRFVLDENDLEERQRFLCINETIETLKDIFRHKKYTDSFILDALNINSFNIENTFNYLLNPNGNNKSFNNTEDYTIQNMKETSHYQTLIEKKGIDSIQEREAYLSN